MAKQYYELVTLYPKKNGTGGPNKADGQLVPQNLVQKFLKNGWSTVPDVSDAKVASSLIEQAQREMNAEKAKIEADRAEVLALRSEIEEMRKQLALQAEAKEERRTRNSRKTQEV